MRIIRYLDSAGAIQHGEQHPDGAVTRLAGDPFHKLEPTQETADLTKLLAPVAPVAIFCIGLNYWRHAEETGARLPEYPVLFMKGINAVQHPGGPIVLPRGAAATVQVDYECELAVVIGRAARDVSRAEALDHVLGYTCANDVSARDWQKEKGGSQWCRGKTFDTFCPLGPALVTPDEVGDPNALAIRTTLNGEVMQESSTADMVFGVAELIEFLSQSTTLLPGTVILTGTPEGVGMARNPQRWLRAGDRVVVEVERVGALENEVV